MCVVCPAVVASNLPSMRQVFRGPTRAVVEELRVLANEATLSRQRGRSTTGQFVHQQDIDGRAARVGDAVGMRPRLLDRFQ